MLFLTSFELRLLVRGAASGLDVILANRLELPLDVLEDHLTLAFNTLVYATLTQSFVTGLHDADPILNVTAQTVPDGGEAYMCHEFWLVVVTFFSLVLEAAAVSTILLKWHTRPDFTAYASSLTMQNHYRERECLRETSALDGRGRSLEMGDARFRIADVKAGMNIGQLALVPVGKESNGRRQGEDAPPTRLMKEKVYD